MKVDDTAQNENRCICPGCPTYNECMGGKGQKLFCAKGKTECNPEQHGCICPECPVASEYGLKDTYYCRRGKAE